MTEEYIDILDDGGHPTGKAASKSAVHRDGLRHRTAHVWIMNANGERLLDFLKDNFS